jgi:hypothetical protein
MSPASIVADPAEEDTAAAAAATNAATASRGASGGPALQFQEERGRLRRERSQQEVSFQRTMSITRGESFQPIKRSKSVVLGEDDFQLHPTSLQVPQHMWDHFGGHFSLPHHWSLGRGGNGALRLGRRLRRLIHMPGLPILRNWRFMKQHFVADLCAGITCGVMLIPQGK